MTIGVWKGKMEQFVDSEDEGGNEDHASSDEIKGAAMMEEALNVITRRPQYPGAAVRIGPRNEWQATLPLTPAEAFLATDQQRNRIGREALEGILYENAANRRLDFSVLREMIMKRTGLDDAAASLVLYAGQDMLEDF